MLFNVITMEKGDHFDFDYARCQETSENDDQPLANVSNQQLDIEAIIEILHKAHEQFGSNTSIIIDKKQAARGEWDDQKKLVYITDARNLKQYIPHVANGNKFLYPFEALFLLECRTLSISFHNMILSIEDAYQLLLTDQRQTKLYRIFSVLSRSGYYVIHSEFEVLNASNSSSETNVKSDCSLKRTLEDISIEVDGNKKASFNSSKDIYKVVTSVRPLRLNHLIKLTKSEKKMLSSIEPQPKNDDSGGLLYCVKNSSIPIETHRILKPLYEGHTTPLIGLGDIPTTNQLFDLIKQSGPKCLPNNLIEFQQDEFCFKIDFKVFTSKQQAIQKRKEIFRVVTLSEDDLFPTVKNIVQLQGTGNSPLLYAFVTNSLDFNFFGLERLLIEDEYPSLWDKYYASECHRVNMYN